MSDPTSKLRQMRDIAPDQSDAIANSISQIDAQITELTEQVDAIQDEVMDVSEAELVDYLENTKLQEIAADSTADHRVSYGGTFGSSTWGPPKGNISDWAIQKLVFIIPVPPPILPPVPTWINVYVYLGVGWDGDATITELITDYAFGNDYLWRPLIGSGLGSEASYGLYPTISNLGVGRGYQVQNKNKVDASVDIFTRYID